MEFCTDSYLKIDNSWLHHNFNDNYDENFVIDSIKNNIKIKEGYVYCITAETINHVKIGF